jgi:hypothetical protein
MTSPRYRAWTKATNRESGPPRRSAHWITARRAWFKVFNDRLECGNWNIPFDSITEAVVYEVRQGLLTAQVLEVSTPEGTRQFGFNPWVKIADHLPFAVRCEQVRMRWSMFSIALRVGAVAYLLYVMFRK